MGSAVDGKRVYTANANSNAVPWTLPSGAVTTTGVWSALDAATGQVIWQRSSPNPSNGIFGDTSGPPTTANGVVYACSLEPQGHMYALERGDRGGALELRQRRVVPLGCRHLQRHALLGIGVLQLRCRHAQQQALRVRPTRMT